MELKEDLQAFNPRLREYRFKLWVRVVTPDYAYYHVYWGRIAGTVVALLVMGWLVFAGGVWGFLRYRRDYQDANYVDIVFYPWRAEQFRRGLARHYLALGYEAVEKKNWGEGYALLTAGLRRVPEDLAARRQVAIMQVRYGLVHRALDTLIEGLPYQPDLDYLKLMFGWLLEAKEDARLLEVAEKFLPAKPDADLKHLFVALEAATAHFERGRYEETERIVNEWQLTNSLEGEILLAKCDAERGFPERAIQRLEGELDRFGKRDELYLELVRLHRAQGNRADARRFALLRQFNAPQSPGARIDVLHAYHQTDDKASEARELETFLTDFRTDARALNELGWFASSTHQPALLQRLSEIAQAQQFPVANLTLAQAQEAIEREAYREALKIIDAATMEKDSYEAQLLEGMRAVALFGIGDFESGHRAALRFAESARLRAEHAILFSRLLRLLGVPQEARAMLERACSLDPLNEPALAELVRLQADAGDRRALDASLPKLLKLRKPSRAVLEEVLLRLQQSGDAELAAQVREAISRSTKVGG